MRLLIPITLLLIVSCSESKKGQKAVNRVNADANLQNQVAEKYLQVHPCVSDTVTEWQHDSTTVTNTIYKTKIDTFTKDGTKYIFRLDTAFFEKTRYQTQTKIVVDREKENRLTDTINNLRIQREWYKSANNEKNEAIGAAKKERNSLLWWLIAAISAGILSHIAPILLNKKL